MPEVFSLQSSENDPDQRKLSIIQENDRYTPASYGNSDGRKIEIYHLGGKTDFDPIQDEPSLSPPMNSARPPYTPSVKSPYPSSRNVPEVYHLQLGDDNQNIDNYGSSPTPVSSNRILPTVNENFDGKGPEMYYIQQDDDNNNRNQSSPIHDSISRDDRNQEKITMYVLESTDHENLRPPSFIERTSSPPIRSAKKKQAFANDTIDDNNRYDAPTKHRPVPIVLNGASTNIRYVPLSQSKASESIQRSMEKFRFGNN